MRYFHNMTRKNSGPCVIHGCTTQNGRFRTFTELAYQKTLKKDTFHNFQYLCIGNQLCDKHYLTIIEPDRNDRTRTEMSFNNILTMSTSQNEQVNWEDIKIIVSENTVSLLKKNFQRLIKNILHLNLEIQCNNEIIEKHLVEMANIELSNVTGIVKNFTFYFNI